MGTDFLGDIFLFIEVMDAVRVFKGYALVRQSLIETRLVAVRSIPCWFYLVRVQKNHFHTLKVWHGASAPLSRTDLHEEKV